MHEILKKLKNIEKNAEKRKIHNKKLSVIQKITYKTRSFYIKAKQKLNRNKQKVLYSSIYNAVYFPIPKVANSSLREILGKTFQNKNQVDLSGEEFKFAFVRNPYERLVSCYRDKFQRESSIDNAEYVEGFRRNLLYMGFTKKDGFKQFVKKVHSMPDQTSDIHFKSQYIFLTDKQGRLLPDFIGKFENLQRDYRKVCRKIGIKSLGNLPHKRSSGKGNWKEYYDDETKKLVYKRYKRDFELFGYNKED